MNVLFDIVFELADHCLFLYFISYRDIALVYKPSINWLPWPSTNFCLAYYSCVSSFCHYDDHLPSPALALHVESGSQDFLPLL